MSIGTYLISYHRYLKKKNSGTKGLMKSYIYWKFSQVLIIAMGPNYTSCREFALPLKTIVQLEYF